MTGPSVTSVGFAGWVAQGVSSGFLRYVAQQRSFRLPGGTIPFR